MAITVAALATVPLHLAAATRLSLISARQTSHHTENGQIRGGQGEETTRQDTQTEPLNNRRRCSCSRHAHFPVTEKIQKRNLTTRARHETIANDYYNCSRRSSSSRSSTANNCCKAWRLYVVSGRKYPESRLAKHAPVTALPPLAILPVFPARSFVAPPHPHPPLCSRHKNKKQKKSLPVLLAQGKKIIKSKQVEKIHRIRRDGCGDRT